MGSKATLRYARISPRKLRLVIELIKGKKAEEAVVLLEHTPKKGADIVRKVLRSAIYNASQNTSIDIDTLFVKSITVDGGPVLKRFRPMSMGRAGKIRRRTSHLNIILAEG